MVPVAFASTFNAFHVCFCNGLYPDWSARVLFWLSQRYLPFTGFLSLGQMWPSVEALEGHANKG